jgi:hypothetical protein
MDESAKTPNDWLGMLVGAVLLAGAALVLCLPVYLGIYDRYGMQIECGNGYESQLLQASINDREQARQPGPATNYVNQCESALLHRRAWVLPIAGLGAVILIPELVAWARGESPNSPGPTSEGLAEPADLHDAALLDRRYRSHRQRPHGTTL